MNWLKRLWYKLKYPDVRFYGDASIKKGVKIGRGTGIGEYVIIASKASIGKNCIILYHVTISKGTCIFDGVFIGPNTSLLNDKYPPSKISQPVVVCSNAIIGGGVTLCPDVVIGRNSVVGSGSTVTRRVPSNEVWVGNPAKYLMSRNEYDRKKLKLYNLVQKDHKV